jgi:predicted nucleic acid-binding protein
VAFLLDTDVVSELRRKSPDPNVAAWARANARAGIYISVLVVGEIRHGIEKIRDRDPRKADTFELWLDNLVEAYRDRILPVTVAVADEWGQLTGPAIDGLMAATAKVQHLTFVTRNVADVATAGVALINPFEPS